MARSKVRGFLSVLDELLWALRRDGFVVSTAQAIDVAAAVQLVGLEDEAKVRDAIAAVVVQRASERRRFDASVEAFFRADGAAPRGRTLWERLADEGFGEEEIEAARALLEQVAAQGPDGASSVEGLLARGAELDRLLALAGVARRVDADSGLQLGFQTHRLLGQLGTGRVRQSLGALRTLLRDSLGAERGEALADALARELERAEEDVRAHVRRTYEARVAEVERQRAGSGRWRRRRSPRSRTRRSRRYGGPSGASPSGSVAGPAFASPPRAEGPHRSPPDAAPRAPDRAASPSPPRARSAAGTGRSSCSSAT